MAAINAAKGGCHTILLEKNDRIGKKLYATGNGRCNLTNLSLTESCYHGDDASKRMRILSEFPPEALIASFEEMGLLCHDRQGYVYPRTDQASSVVRALELTLKKLGVTVMTETEVTSVRKTSAGFEVGVRAAGKKNGTKFEGSKSNMAADAVIISCGGMAGPQYGCSGDGYQIARSFGHSVTPLHPALTSLISDDSNIRLADGVRCAASIRIGSSDRADGELQIASYGLSGIPVFQVSQTAAMLLDNNSSVTAIIDFLPEIPEEKWQEIASARISSQDNQPLGDLFAGLVHEKVLRWILSGLSLQPETKRAKVSDEQIADALRLMRSFEVSITGLKGYDKAQTTSGGVPLAEVDDNLMSTIYPGLFLTGELLNTDGLCGGYNLQWAFATGRKAGIAAAAELEFQ
ncbi:MAG: aminoacetone oxidase family FAD-binding enzyme [Lachnospiraceae bacterium]|nr:aminoacetone oxidase family FAD-binding enzyme [Lachnospiraceae bacterium]